jgi:hypothetical protein
MMKVRWVMALAAFVVAGCGSAGLSRGTYALDDDAHCEYGDPSGGPTSRLNLDGEVQILDVETLSDLADGCTDMVWVSSSRTCELCAIPDPDVPNEWQLVARHEPGSVITPDCVLSDGVTTLEGDALSNSSLRVLDDGRLALNFYFTGTSREGSAMEPTSVACQFNAAR